MNAVVHCPGGVHPSYVQGFYDRDNTFYRDWTPISKDPRALQEWLAEWVHNVPDRAAYLAKLGDHWPEALAVGQRLSDPVNYGRRLA